MVALVNEWQLKSQLNLALLQERPAEFVLWLAMLSPRVEEMAQFEPLPLSDQSDRPDLYQKLQVRKQRDYAFNATDVETFAAQHQALLVDGFQQWRLHQLLQPAAVVIKHDAKKLSADVEASLGFHVKRRLTPPQAESPETMQADPTQLYDMLQGMAGY